ncbi:hypothetical protein BHE74_00018341 [Ensete ventricosum]|uniref:Uncharacterized protein n=1 Tax=Ensete ventricosum TaxID=4639 RepID=A0A445MG96_ENSVE|nr:hypothetical protein BHE74_00018341 [Ensete ventricosum]RZR73243.1 hypothetical protein BHM03_00021828 [Ensete ventricosum]
MGKKILPTPRSWRTAGLRDAVVMTLVADDCFEDGPQDDPSSPPPAVAVAFAALKLVYAWGGRRFCSWRSLEVGILMAEGLKDLDSYGFNQVSLRK